MVLTYEYGGVRDGDGTVQGPHAKIANPTQERAMLGSLDTARYPSRDRVMFLLSMKAGLRAKAMAALTWAIVTNATGQVGEAIQLQNRASKGTTGGRTIPLHPDLWDALIALQTARRETHTPGPGGALFRTRRGGCRRPRCVCGSIGSLPP
jgi:integrase